MTTHEDGTENSSSSLPLASASRGHFPAWLHRRMPSGANLAATHLAINTSRLATVCEEAKCPNLLECYSKGTATFLALGKACTRACPFCSIDFAKNPKPIEADEPMRIVHSAQALGLTHVVVTMVARDDLSDGGATHMADIIHHLHREMPHTTVEVLTSDFEANFEALDTVLKARPEIFNHNIETVRELTARVRHKASYDRTLAVLRHAKKRACELQQTSDRPLFIKSGLMVGLGETPSQVHHTLQDLFEVGCDIVTIGQYLKPTTRKLEVRSFVDPALFNQYAAYGRLLGLKYVFAGPFVRSSYNAKEIFTMLVQSC